MPECVCLPKCPFFHDQMADMPAMSDMLKHRYCLGDSAHCARHMVFEAMGREAVPADLFPNEIARAEAVLATAEG